MLTTAEQLAWWKAALETAKELERPEGAGWLGLCELLLWSLPPEMQHAVTGKGEEITRMLVGDFTASVSVVLRNFEELKNDRGYLKEFSGPATETGVQQRLCFIRKQIKFLEGRLQREQRRDVRRKK